MSCEIYQTATLEGVSKFFDTDKAGGNESDPEGSRNTLQNFKISISPSGEIIVFARSSWILICGSKWDSSSTDGAKIKYRPNWHGHINCKPGEEITGVLCLPFFCQGQQSIWGCADWTCIVLGFSSGCLRFYTEAMQELACSILHEEIVTDIKYFCIMPASYTKGQKQENPDVYVLYKSVICVLNGSLLSQVLRKKRNELAKSSSCNTEADVYTPLDFRKYSFVGQEEVTDACFLGQTLTSSFNTFDHLVTTSLVGGFGSNFKTSPPQTSLIVTSGRKPFVGFHYTFEGGNSPVLSDVALAVASKIKSSVAATLPDWLGFGSKKSQAEKPKEVAQNYAEKLNCRFGLCDLWRQGQSVIVSPSGEYSVVTDSLGRVLLVDNAAGIALRLWKGYRDAQCGFLQVQEDSHRIRRSKKTPKPQPRQGLFVVIYAPKKGLIEIFSAQHGLRIANFKVTKFGRLLYIPRDQIGSRVSAGGFNFCQNQVIFISVEGLKEFLVPFHYALLEDNSKMARDLHVLKKMKMLLKMENNGSSCNVLEEIEKCARDLKTDEVRLQAVESLVTYKGTTLEAFKIVLEVFLEDAQNPNQAEEVPRKLILFSRVMLNFLLFYEFLVNLKDKSSNDGADGTKETDLSEVLRLPPTELDNIFKLIEQIKEIEKVKKEPRVAFEEKKSSQLGQYLSCFDFESVLSSLSKVEKQEEDKGKDAYRLSLKTTDKENKLHYLGEILFKRIFGSLSSLHQWKKHAENCNLDPADLALCLLSYWCNKNNSEDISQETCFMVEALKSISSLLDSNDVVVEYNTESLWWKRLRHFIAENPYAIRGLLAALCCRSVTIFVEQERELESKPVCDKKETAKSNLESGEALRPQTPVHEILIKLIADALIINNDWETISKDTCQWDILVLQLQDVALLNAVLSLRFKTENKFPEVPFDFEYQCLASIHLNGSGSVSELVAKWLVQFGFEPSSLLDKNDLEFQKSADEKKEEEKSVLIMELDKANEARGCDENLNLALDYLALLKTRFPYSLTSSSLLGNMCWEYIAFWCKNVKELNYLEAALRYLENIPSGRIKYGISFLSWNTYLMDKFETLAKMMNRIGKVPRDKLCTSEIGLRSDQILLFLQLVVEFLKIIFYSDTEDKPNFGTNREAIWQGHATSSSASLVFIALSQPVVNTDLISFHLQLSYSLLMMTGLNVKHEKVFLSLFDIVERVNFTLSGNPQVNSHYQYVKLKNSRTEFLKKCLTAAVQTVDVVEYIPPVSTEDASHTIPTTKLKVEDYKKWLQICFDLANVWALSVDELRRHQVCELYSCGFDRLAEEVIPSVNETQILASQLLVLGGKRLKYLIQDSKDFYKGLTKLSANLSEWLHTLDLKHFTYHGSIDDIEVLMRYAAKWLPEDQTEQNLAVAIIDSLFFLRNKNTNENDGDCIPLDN